MAYLRATDLSKTFDGVDALRGVSLAVDRGAALGLFGPTGSGKTTLLRLIAGLDRPDSGHIEVDEKIVSGNGHFIAPRDRDLGMVFQDLALWPHLDVQRQLDFVLKERYTNRASRETRLDELIVRADLESQRRKRPAELSGGESQRLAFARALANEPKLLLLDEPFAHLDATSTRSLIKWLHELMGSGTTIVVASHDHRELARLCGTILDLCEDPYRLEAIPKPPSQS